MAGPYGPPGGPYYHYNSGPPHPPPQQAFGHTGVYAGPHFPYPPAMLPYPYAGRGPPWPYQGPHYHYPHAPFRTPGHWAWGPANNGPNSGFIWRREGSLPNPAQGRQYAEPYHLVNCACVHCVYLATVPQPFPRYRLWDNDQRDGEPPRPVNASAWRSAQPQTRFAGEKPARSPPPAVARPAASAPADISSSPKAPVAGKNSGIPGRQRSGKVDPSGATRKPTPKAPGVATVPPAPAAAAASAGGPRRPNGPGTPRMTPAVAQASSSRTPANEATYGPKNYSIPVGTVKKPAAANTKSHPYPTCVELDTESERMAPKGDQTTGKNPGLRGLGLLGAQFHW